MFAHYIHAFLLIHCITPWKKLGTFFFGPPGIYVLRKFTAVLHGVIVGHITGLLRPSVRVVQGSDTRVRTQKTLGFFGYTHLKTHPQKNPHFYFNLLIVYTLYATNSAIFYSFKAFKALIC